MNSDQRADVVEAVYAGWLATGFPVTLISAAEVTGINIRSIRMAAARGEFEPDLHLGGLLTRVRGQRVSGLSDILPGTGTRDTAALSPTMAFLRREIITKNHVLARGAISDLLLSETKQTTE